MWVKLKIDDLNEKLISNCQNHNSLNHNCIWQKQSQFLEYLTTKEQLNIISIGWNLK